VSDTPIIWFERPPSPDLRAEIETVGRIADDDELAVADAVMAGARTYDAAFMDRAPNAKVICRTGIGVDKVDIAAATERGIAVCNTPDGPTTSTAEHAVALMLAAAKQLKLSERRMRVGETDLYASHEAVELDGATLGLVGYGRIARRVGAAARGLGMHVAAYDPFLGADDFAGARRMTELGELLAAADVVSVHVPLTDASAGLFDAAMFERMKPGAIFVNTARGGLVDQDALLDALDSGRLHSAGLDVTDPEPLPSDHPLLHRDDVVVTPHVASGTGAGKRRIVRMAFEQVMQVLGGERPTHLRNPDVWESVTRRLQEEAK
jgi:D-3-phosphoglycerate dehydrogenase